MRDEAAVKTLLTTEDYAMLIRVRAILQQVARDHPDEPVYDEAHSAFYHIEDLVKRIEQHEG